MVRVYYFKILQTENGKGFITFHSYKHKMIRVHYFPFLQTQNFKVYLRKTGTGIAQWRGVARGRFHKSWAHGEKKLLPTFEQLFVVQKLGLGGNWIGLSQ